MERLKAMKDRLVNCVEQQLDNISAADTKELGEAVDMIKDLEETIYYATVTKAMNESGKDTEAEMLRYPSRYYDSGMIGNNARGGGSRGYGYYEPYYYGDIDRMYYDDRSSYNMGRNAYNMNGSSSQGGNSGSRNYQDFRDYREGRSGSSRRMYMESKEMHEGKEKQMMELEKYMKELSGDVMEMINDATPEEKQILSQKLTTLAEKIR